MIKPSKLKLGDTVGVVSPAGPVGRSDLEAGLRFLENKGFNVHVAPHVYDRREYMAGNDEDRLSDFEDMFRNPEIKAVFCSRGGYGSLRLLDRMDYDLIGNNPKIIVGYSDITALLAAIFKRTGLITFHGPMVKGFPELPDKRWQDLFLMISSEKPISFNPMEGYSLNGGKATGPVIGGNLSLLSRLLGTPYMPDMEGSILFLEDRGEALYRLDRMFTHLALSGRLKGVNGLIIGRFTDCGDPVSVQKLIMEHFEPMNIPIAAGFPLGHDSDNITFPLGIAVTLDTNAMKLSLLEPTVS